MAPLLLRACYRTCRRCALDVLVAVPIRRQDLAAARPVGGVSDVLSSFSLAMLRGGPILGEDLAVAEPTV